MAETKLRKPFVHRPLVNPPNAIQGLRLLHGLSASALARSLDPPLDPSHIRHAERRGTGLGKENWKRVAAYFGVEPWELHDPSLPQKLKERPVTKPKKNSKKFAP